MTAPALGHFIAQAAAQSRASLSPADSVQALAPLMLDLTGAAGTFLEPQHFQSDPAHYTRNLI